MRIFIKKNACFHTAWNMTFTNVNRNIFHQCLWMQILKRDLKICIWQCFFKSCFDILLKKKNLNIFLYLQIWFLKNGVRDHILGSLALIFYFWHSRTITSYWFLRMWILQKDIDICIRENVRLHHYMVFDIFDCKYFS